MAITFTTRPLSTNLTTVANAQERLKLGPGVEEPLLGRLIAGATSTILTHCGQEFARCQVTETLKGYGDGRLMVGRTPIVTLGTVLYNSEPVTDFTVDDADAGLLTRRLGTEWTRQWAPGWIQPWQVPYTEEAAYTATYWAGFIGPEDDLATATLSATAVTKTYTVVDRTMPLVVAGEVIRVAGFANSANNGEKTVASRTATTIVVTDTLVDEAADAEDQRTLVARTLPGALERACLDTVQEWYLNRGQDPRVQSRTLGDLSVTYRAMATEDNAGLPYSALGLLAPFVRIR